jgi:hypothetical protein
MTTSFFKALAIAVLLLVATRAQALHTPYMAALSNQVSQYQAFLTTVPGEEKKARALLRALNVFSRPSTSIAQDYDRFLNATLQLGQFAFTDTNLLNGGTNVFIMFMNDAGVEIFVTQARLNALNPFVRTKKAASNQLAQALSLLIANSTETNLTLGLLRGGQVFRKLVNAQRLTTLGEANQGFAANSVLGGNLFHEESDSSGTITFTNATEFSQTDGGETSGGTYTYTRTGLNTATLVLVEEGGTNTVPLRFTSAGAGRFTYRFVGNEGTERGSGRFTLTFVE